VTGRQKWDPALTTRVEVIAAMFSRLFPKVEAMLREAADDITAFASFPVPC
jgi:putative transposase